MYVDVCVCACACAMAYVCDDLCQEMDAIFHASVKGFQLPNFIRNKVCVAIKLLWFILQGGVRDNATIMNNTALGVIFGVKKYAERLLEVVKKKDIQLNYKHKLERAQQRGSV